MAWINKENNDDKSSTLKERLNSLHHSHVNLDDTNNALSLLKKIRIIDEITAHLIAIYSTVYGRQGMFDFYSLSNW